MDATAEVNRAYELHDETDVKRFPEGCRSYANVTLHVAKGIPVGKERLKPKTVFPAIYENLADKLGGKMVFGLTHKKNRDLLKAYAPANVDVRVGHWGAIDGSNDWQDCEVAIIAGLSYRKETDFVNTYMAYQGIRDNAWFTGRRWREYPNIQTAIRQGVMSSDVVQAMNRIRCRRVIDAEGNCPKADIYLILPFIAQDAESLLADIQRLMPGINIVTWNLPVEQAHGRPSAMQMVVSLLAELPDGETITAKEVQERLEVSKATLKRLSGNPKFIARLNTIGAAEQMIRLNPTGRPERCYTKL
jgi:hypothetical protein